MIIPSAGAMRMRRSCAVRRKAKLRVRAKIDEADDRPDDVAPRGERDRGLADEPVQEPPREAGRQDDQRDADEEPLAKAQVRRVGRIGADRERALDELARPPPPHDRRG